jgi:outer membrane translocation and assembly module TamA
VFSVDTRDKPVFPGHGVRLSLRGALMPELWDVESTFGLVSGDVTTFLSAGRRATLALRAGGKKLWGDYPFFEAATIGGGALDNGPIQEPPDTVRGFRSRRFMGDASLYGNAELRLRLSRMNIIVPGDWGLFGFVDSGRVFKNGEDSNTWHTGAGGGLWLTWLNDRIGLSAAVAHSTEDDLFYLKGGFSF